MLNFEFLFIALADSSRVSFAVPPSPVFPPSHLVFCFMLKHCIYMKKKLILNKFSLRYLESFDVLSPYGRAERLGGPETMKNCKRNSIFF